MTLETIMKACRRAYRRVFTPNPPMRLDGPYIRARMALSGVSWEQALAERGRMNVDRIIRWRDGEKVL